MEPSGFNDSTPITDPRQLHDYFTTSCKPKSDWTISTAHEKFPFRLSTQAPVGYDTPKGIRDLFQVLKIFGWREILEGDNIVGLKRGFASITCGPGCQVAMSGAQVKNLHETAAEIDQHFQELKEVAQLLDLGFLGLGCHPTARNEELPRAPLAVHRIICAAMPLQGKSGLDMMLRTCGIRVTLDYTDEADMIRKMRVATALQPVATALFAASPFTEGKPNGFQSCRMQLWQDTDSARCGFLPFVFAENFGFARYIAYALDAPMYYVLRDGKYHDATGQSFGDFMTGKLPALPGATPTIADWHNHLTCLFPDVRLNQNLEMRGADCGTAESILALPCFWTGLLYDDAACQAALNLVQNWTLEEHVALRRDVPQQGLRLSFRGAPLCDIAHKALRLAQHGLRRRAIRLHGGADETRYLDGLFMITESGDSYADALRMRLENNWQGNILGVFADARLQA